MTQYGRANRYRVVAGTVYWKRLATLMKMFLYRATANSVRMRRQPIALLNSLEFP